MDQFQLWFEVGIEHFKKASLCIGVVDGQIFVYSSL